MKYLAFLVLFSSASVFGQQTSNATPEVPPAPETTPSTPVTLAQSPEGNPNILSFDVGARGVYDNNSQGGYQGGAVDWGVLANHHFERGALSLNYRGDYGDYAGAQAYSGTDQSLNFAIEKALTRHWSVSFSQAAGIFKYGASYFSVQPIESNTVQTNPFSSDTKFLSSSFAATYQQSLRLSYIFTVSYYLSRYAGAAPFGISAVTASGAASYRLTARTTLTGTYSFSDYQYQNLGGQAQIHSVYATVSHQFRNRWTILASAGGSRSQSSGVVDLALSPTLLQLLGTTYVAGSYNTTTYVPYFEGSVSRQIGHANVSVSGGQSITPGNGLYLASKNLNVTGYFSYTWRLSSIGFGGSYYRLGSVSNSAQPYSTEAFSASYGYPLTRHIGLNLRYDLINYSQVNNSNLASS
ncbi:MAG TPA: hypothetical protein VG168_16175, partial [Bryobacteraceae bacterium]|nr:hypothetical protein [Bryobacteraceae bacterium]